MRVPDIAIAVCGPARHGKSTLTGRILCESGSVTRDEVQRQWEMAPFRIARSTNAGDDLNPYNWLVLHGMRDTEPAEPGHPERNPGRQPPPARARIDRSEVAITAVDLSMLSRFGSGIVHGLHAADFALLVVEARCGLDAEGRRLLVLLERLDVPLGGVFVSKMDTVAFSREAFASVRRDVRREIEGLGMAVPDIVPVHALAGDGEFETHPQMAWHQGPRPLDVFRNTIRTHESARSEETRFAARERYLVPGVGTALVGILESGVVRIHDELSVLPARGFNTPARVHVQSIVLADLADEAGHGSSGEQEVAARRFLSIGTSLNRHDAEQLLRYGAVLGHPEAPPTVARRIEAEILFFRPHRVRNGSTFVVQAGVCSGPAMLEAILDREELLAANPAEDPETVIAERIRGQLRFERPICIESDHRFERLKRFILLERHRIVGCGTCTRIRE